MKRSITHHPWKKTVVFVSSFLLWITPATSMAVNPEKAIHDLGYAVQTASHESDNPIQDASDGNQTQTNLDMVNQTKESLDHLTPGQGGVNLWPTGQGNPEYDSYTDGEQIPVEFSSSRINPDTGKPFVMTGTLFGPPGVHHLNPKAKPVYPGIVFTPGFSASKELYYWISEAYAKAGYIVLVFDVVGQGHSQGTQQDTNAPQDLKDAVNYFFSTDNPFYAWFDPDRFGLSGHSMGAMASCTLADQNHPLFDRRVKAVVALSGNTSIHNVVPVEAQTADFDGSVFSPQFLGVGALSFSPGYSAYHNFKSAYDTLHPDKEIVVIEGGNHDAFTNVSGVYAPAWFKQVSARYAVAWFNRYLKNDVSKENDAQLFQPDPHLSKAFPSYYNLGNGEVQMTEPTAYSLGMGPQETVDYAQTNWVND
jgi:pimeloyl-ACP methyl ester carboxylesterase